MTAGGQPFTFSATADIQNALQALRQLEERANVTGAALLRALNLRVNVVDRRASAAQLQELEREVVATQNRLNARGIDVPVRVNVRDAERDILNFRTTAEGALRGLFRGAGFGGGVPVGLGFGAGAAGVVAAGQAVEGLTRNLVQGFQAGIQYNSMLEQATRQFVRYTGSAEGAQKILEQLTQYADATPFGTEETIKVGQDLIRVTDGNIERMQQLLELTGALAVTNPYQGLEGASYAIRELLAGDTQSFADRFNVSRTLLQQLRREATSTDEYIKLAVAAAGGSIAQIEGLSQTFQGRISTIQSFIAQLGQRLTSGFFGQLSGAAGDATEAIKAHGDQWKDTAEGIGVSVAAIVAAVGEFISATSQGVQGLGAVFGLDVDFAELGKRAKKEREAQDEARVPVQQKEQYQANLAGIKAATEALQPQKAALDDVDIALKQNAASLQHITNEAKAIQTAYAQQIRPLERQLEILQRPEFNRERRIAALDVGIAQASAREIRAGPSPETQGAVAQRRAELDVQIRLTEIENKRAEIAQQFVDAATRGKSALEQQAEAQSKVVAKLQEEQQQSQDVRSRRLEGLRAEIDAAQDARDVRLNALREENRSVQENRREAIDSLREQARVAQERRRDDLDSLRESHRAELEAISDADRAFEQSHRQRMSQYQEQIDALRQRLDADKQQGKSPAEQSLAGLDKQERERSRVTSLADAVRAVREADTIKERLDARRRLIELQHEQQVAKQREVLQATIEREKEAREERRAQIQEKINVLERKSREDDRTYQQQREARREITETTQRAFQEQERLADRQAKEKDRADDKAVREAERVSKELDRVADRKIRDEEKGERAQRDVEQAAIRTQEVANREADRIAQETIRAEQKKERELDRAAAEQRDAQQEARQRASDERAARLAPLELARLENEARLLNDQDAAVKARAEGERVRLEAVKAIETAEGNIYKANQSYAALGLQEQIVSIKDAEYQRLEAVTQQKEQIELARGSLQEQKLTLEAQIALLNDQIGLLRSRNALMLADDNPLRPPGGGPGQARIPQALPTNPIATAIIGSMNSSTEIRVGTDIVQKAVNGFFTDFTKVWRDLSIGVSKILPDELVAGLTTGLAGDNSAEAESLSWSQRIFNSILGFFGISSPSTVMRDIFAKGLIDGAVLGIQDGQQAVVDAVIGLFGGIGNIAAEAIVGEHGIVTLFRNGLNSMNIDITTIGPQITENLIRPFVTADLGGKALQLKTDVINAWNTLSGDLTTNGTNILNALKSPFESLQTTFFPPFLQNMLTTGINAGVSWINGWNQNNPVTAVMNTFNGLFSGFFQTLNNLFNASGLSAAVSWINGYVQQFNNWIRSNPLISGALGLGGGGQQQPQQQQVAAAAPQQQYANNYGGRSDPLPNIHSRHSGGDVWPGEMFKIRRDEAFASFSQPGSVISPEMLRRMGSGGVDGGGRSNIQVTIANGAVQVQTGGSVDERQLAEKIGKQVVHAVYAALDEAERFAPDPVSRTLPGAD